MHRGSERVKIIFALTLEYWVVEYDSFVENLLFSRKIDFSKMSALLEYFVYSTYFTTGNKIFTS